MSTEGTSSRRRRANDENLTRRLLQATRKALGERGPKGLRIDDIVAECRTSKSAVYRRWENRSELIGAAIESLTWADASLEGADLESDLIELISSWTRLPGASDAQVSWLIRAITLDEFSREQYERSVWPTRRVELAALIARHFPQLVPAEIPEPVLRLPQGFVIDAVVARGLTVTRAQIEDFVRSVLVPLLRGIAGE